MTLEGADLLQFAGGAYGVHSDVVVAGRRGGGKEEEEGGEGEDVKGFDNF